MYDDIIFTDLGIIYRFENEKRTLLYKDIEDYHLTMNEGVEVNTAKGPVLIGNGNNKIQIADLIKAQTGKRAGLGKENPPMPTGGRAQMGRKMPGFRGYNANGRRGD